MTTSAGQGLAGPSEGRWLLVGRVITPFERWPMGAVAVEGERIAAVGPREEVLRVLPDPEGWRLADFGGAWLIPGMIDLHTHGARGADVMTGARDALATVARVEAEGGATGFLLTTRTAPPDALLAVADMVGHMGDLPGAPWDGAGLLGLHLEGPYIHPRRAGGQPAQYIRDPDLREMEALAEMASGRLAMVTFAPERPGGLELARWLSSRGIVAALGHSNASYEEALAAFRSGVSQLTHAFNAMPSLHHREPGALMAGLLDDRVTIHLIADGVHVHPAALALAYRAKGPDRIALITDSTGAGLAPGQYEIAGRTIVVDDHAVRLPDGTLAGSKLQMNRALQVCVEQVGIPMADAVRMASTTAARVLGLGARKGVLAAGYDADVSVLAPDFTVLAVMVMGRFVVGEPGGSHREGTASHGS